MNPEGRLNVAISIDPGVHTGFAVWSIRDAEFLAVKSMPIHEAMDAVRGARQSGQLVEVVIEDARQRKGSFGKMDAKMARYGAGVREGVGSVKRDCGIWEAYLQSLGVTAVMQKPTAGGTKWTHPMFTAATGWTHPTNEHGRDAALLLLARYGQRRRAPQA